MYSICRTSYAGVKGLKLLFYLQKLCIVNVFNTLVVITEFFFFTYKYMLFLLFQFYFYS